MTEIKLKSSAMTVIGRRRDDYLSLLLDAAAPVLHEGAGAGARRVYLSSFAPAELCGIDDPLRQVGAALGEAYPEMAGFEMRGPFKTGGQALYTALEESQEVGGDFLILSGEKMTHVDARKAAGLLAPRSNPVEQMYGATLPALGALVTQAYMRSYDVPYRSFHSVAIKSHRNAHKNPKAHFQKEITMEDVRKSPVVADPLLRHHCAPISDGAAACLLGPGDGNVTIKGWGRGLDRPLFHERHDLARFPAAAQASQRAFAMARTARADIDVIEIHDAFSPFELINLEEMGFYPMGTSWRALEDGALEIGERLSVNPSGGMKARGHPIGACGITSVVEIHEQLTGRAGERQHPKARAGMIQSAGGVSRDCYAFILEAQS